MTVSENPHIRMIFGDSIEAMRKMSDNAYPLAIVDPEYGIGESSRVRSSDGTRKVKQKNGRYLTTTCNNYTKKDWDSQPPPQEYFDLLFRASRDQIIWGINNFDIDVTPGRIFWDKVNGDNDFSDGELAYCSLHDSIRIVRYMWNGMMQGKSLKEWWVPIGNKKEQEKRIHPTQKPVILYKWLLKNYAQQGDRILDTHGGSGSIVIACYDMGIDLDWFENDKEHYTDALQRFLEHKSQGKLFTPEQEYSDSPLDIGGQP